MLNVTLLTCTNLNATPSHEVSYQALIIVKKANNLVGFYVWKCSVRLVTHISFFQIPPAFEVT